MLQKLAWRKKEIEVINVKCDKNMLTGLLKIEGFHEAYHMNKEKWVTITLDDKVEDEVIFSMIDCSYSQIEKSDAWMFRQIRNTMMSLGHSIIVTRSYGNNPVISIQVM